MAITAATDLSEQTRRHWRSSLTGIAKAFDQPIELIPARYSAVRARMAALHHVPLDWTAKTLANHKSNAKAALIWFAKEKDVLPHGVPLSPAWDRLRVQLTDPSTRYRLMPLMRFCSGVHIEPEAVNEAVIDRYMDHRARTTTRASDAASRRILARLWNAGIGRIDGWPEVRLIEPPVKAAEGPAWDDFPEGLRADIEGYLTGLERIRRNKAGHRSRPCKPSTLTTRKRELVAAVRMAVKVGVPIESLTSLSALIHPDVAEKILDGYWRKDGEVPKTYTINLSCRFVALAHAIGGLDEDALRRLEDARFALEEYREDGMTEKNLALIRLVLTDGVWSRVVNLPEQLMQQARLQRRHAPVRAAVLAQIAVAVAILTVAPVRLGNLASIRLGENLIKPGRTALHLLAHVPQVRRQEQGPAPVQARRDGHGDHRRVRPRLPPRVDARQQRGLAVPRRGRQPQGKDLVQHPDRRAGSEVDWIAHHRAPVPPCGGRSDPQAPARRI